MSKAISLAVLLLGSASLATLQTQSQSTYPVFETDNLSPAIYKQRRQALKQALGTSGAAVIFTNPTRNRSNDTDFRYRPDSNFRYLTGFEEPDAALLLVPGGITVDGQRVTEVLFLNLADAMSATWLGYRMGPDNAERLLGIEKAVANRAFGDVLPALSNVAGLQLAKPVLPNQPSGRVQAMVNQWSEWAAKSGAQAASADMRQLLARMRVQKSPEELALLKKAIDASVEGHIEAIKSTEPGMREYQIQAVVEYVFAKNGCESVGYNSIVGSGPNSCILHYESNRRLMKAGDIMCMDVGGEYHGYTADVTRSFPVNGKFTPEQKAIYNLVLAGQEAGIQACVDGASFGAADAAARKVISDGLVKLGITKQPSEVSRYFMHGTSHYIGLDVHDSHGDNTLKPNYVLTVEPGIYIKEGSPCDPKWWNIGVRIEDDILVTSGAPVNLSAGAPRKVEDIEALMKLKGIGNQPVGGKR